LYGPRGGESRLIFGFCLGIGGGGLLMIEGIASIELIPAGCWLLLSRLSPSGDSIVVILPIRVVIRPVDPAAARR